MNASVVGVWILRSAEAMRIDTGERIRPYGANPRGVLMLHECGRMAGLITPRDQAFQTEAERARAFVGLTAYSGRYRLEPPNRFITEVDVSAFPPWLGSQQARTYTLNGDRLDIVADPAPSRFFDGAQAFSTLSWVRESATGKSA